MSAGPYSIGSDTWPGLSKLIEEMGEVGQVAGKLIATSGEAAHWDGTDLRQRLSEETADLYAAIAFVAVINGLDTPEWRERGQRKLAQFMTWHREQGQPAGHCPACDDGAHDILRPCATCGRSVADKAGVRAARGGGEADRYAFGEGG